MIHLYQNIRGKYIHIYLYIYFHVYICTKFKLFFLFFSKWNTVKIWIHDKPLDNSFKNKQTIYDKEEIHKIQSKNIPPKVYVQIRNTAFLTIPQRSQWSSLRFNLLLFWGKRNTQNYIYTSKKNLFFLRKVSSDAKWNPIYRNIPYHKREKVMYTFDHIYSAPKVGYLMQLKLDILCN